VDAVQREKIMSRYEDHSRRFEEAAARRLNGVVPFSGLLPELQQNPSMREIQVLQLISDGLANCEVGERLCVTEEKVKSHVCHLLAKLQTHSRAHAVAVGFRRGIIS
jgi:DNA-binding NarL/FixJ family response regulator